MESPVALPSNRFLTPQRDRRWPHVLSVVLLVSGIVLTALILVGWPRLRSTSIYYELNRLRTEVDELQRRQHELLVELEREIRILGESVGNRVDEVLVPLDQIVERLAIACLGGPHLLEIDLLGVSLFLGISLRHLPSPGGLTDWGGRYSL